MYSLNLNVAASLLLEDRVVTQISIDPRGGRFFSDSIITRLEGTVDRARTVTPRPASMAACIPERSGLVWASRHGRLASLSCFIALCR